MKNKYMLIGLILSILSTATIAFATEYNPVLDVKGGGVVWVLYNEDLLGNTLFSVKDVDIESLRASYWIGSVYTELTPRNVIVSNNKIMLIFNVKDLPDSADGSKIIGTILGVDTFIATGPAFAWRRSP